MKLNIINQFSKKIVNYNNVLLKEEYNFSDIIDNSCEEILCIDSLDYIQNAEKLNKLQNILSKLRLNGKIVVCGTDYRSLSRLILSESMSPEDYNKEIENKKSLSCSTDIRNFLLSNNLKIESETIRGQKYEITATRK